MEIPVKTTSSSIERDKKYYSYKEGGLKSAIRDSNLSWKWVEIFNSDVIDKEIILNDYIQLDISSDYRKLTVIAPFTQYGKATLESNVTLYVKGTDYYLGYSEANIESSNCILTLKDNSTLILDGAVLHVRNKSNLIIEDLATVILVNNGLISYEAAPDSLDLRGTYINKDTGVTAPLVSTEIFKVPVIKKFYRQNLELSGYDFFESKFEYYDNSEVVSDNSVYKYFTKNEAMSSPNYIMDESVIWYTLNYFYDRGSVTIPILTSLNKESDTDSISIEPSTLTILYGEQIKKTIIKNISGTNAIPKSIIIDGIEYSGDSIFDGVNYFIPDSISCTGTNNILVNYDYKYTYRFFQNNKVLFQDTVWRDFIIESITPENKLLVNDEEFVVDGITYNLNSGIEFLGWYFNNDYYNFSSKLSQNTDLIAHERITI